MSGILFPLKLTISADIATPIGQYILKKKGEQVYREIVPTLTEMQNFRNSLDFYQMFCQVKADYNQGFIAQEKIINYANYIYMIDLILEKDFVNPGIKVPFVWNNSFEDKKKLLEVPHSRYELTSLLYNLGIVYYTEGIALACYTEDQAALSQSVKKFKQAVWCILETKKLVVSLLTIKGMKLPLDLSMDFLNILLNYILGLIYYTQACLYMMDREEEDLIPYYENAAHYFDTANEGFEMLKKCPFDSDFKKTFLANLVSNIVTNRVEALAISGVMHAQIAQFETPGDHQILAYSCFAAAIEKIESIMAKKGPGQYLYPAQKDFLLNKMQEIKTKKDKFFAGKKIDLKKVIKYDALVEQSQGKGMNKSLLPVAPTQPETIMNSLKSENKFSCFFPPEIANLKSTLMSKVTEQLADIQSRFSNLIEIKNKRFANSMVNYLLSFSHEGPKSKPEIPKELREKLDLFRRNGGYLKYESMIEQLKVYQRSCDEVIYEIKLELGNEKQEDDRARDNLTDLWTRPPSQTLNTEYIQSLRKLEHKFVFAVNADNDIAKKFEKYVDWMLKFTDNDEYILSMIPRSRDTEFWLLNKDKIIQISELNNKLSEIIDPAKLKENIQRLVDKIYQRGLIYSLIKILHKEVSADQEFDKILQTLSKDLVPFEVEVEEAYSILDQIISLSKQVDNKLEEDEQSSVKNLEEMTEAITVINALYNDLKTADDFYTQLSIHLNNLKEFVSEFCVSRTIERLSLLEELGIKDESILEPKKPKERPERFFDSIYGKFAQGSSLMIPKAKASDHFFQNMFNEKILESEEHISENQKKIVQNARVEEKPVRNPNKHQIESGALNLIKESVVISQEYNPGSKFQGSNKPKQQMDQPEAFMPQKDTGNNSFGLTIHNSELYYPEGGLKRQTSNQYSDTEESKQMPPGHHRNQVLDSEFVSYKPGSNQQLSDNNNPKMRIDSSEIYLAKPESKPGFQKEIVDSVFIPYNPGQNQQANLQAANKKEEKPQMKPDSSEIYIPLNEAKNLQSEIVDSVFVPYNPNKNAQPANNNNNQQNKKMPVDSSEFGFVPKQEAKNPKNEVIDSVFVPYNPNKNAQPIASNQDKKMAMDQSEVGFVPKQEAKKSHNVIVDSVYEPFNPNKNVQPINTHNNVVLDNKKMPVDNSEFGFVPKQEANNPRNEVIDSVYVPYNPNKNVGPEKANTDKKMPIDSSEFGFVPKQEPKNPKNEVIDSVYVPYNPNKNSQEANNNNNQENKQMPVNNSEFGFVPKQEAKNPKNEVIDSVYVPYNPNKNSQEANNNNNQENKQMPVNNSEFGFVPKQEAKNPKNEVIDSVYVPYNPNKNAQSARGNEENKKMAIDQSEYGFAPKQEVKKVQNEIISSEYVPYNPNKNTQPVENNQDNKMLNLERSEQVGLSQQQEQKVYEPEMVISEFVPYKIQEKKSPDAPVKQMSLEEAIAEYEEPKASQPLKYFHSVSDDKANVTTSLIHNTPQDMTKSLIVRSSQRRDQYNSQAKSMLTIAQKKNISQYSTQVNSEAGSEH